MLAVQERRRYIHHLMLVSIVLLLAQTAVGQRLNFITSTPKIEKFPIVRFHMTASYNGALPVPGATESDLQMTEDGSAVTPMLSDCDESELASVVFCVDVSTSMISSVGDGFEISSKFYTGFNSCIDQLHVGSRYALVTFIDTIHGVFPDASHINGFFSAGDATDRLDFGSDLAAQPYFGGTYVDYALDKAIDMLKYQPFKHRAIVIVTDDGALDYWKYDSLFEANHITYYVMEVGSDSSPHNLFLAHSSGGIYFQAKDTVDYATIMQQLGELISSEHCTLTYLSDNPCPWYNNHQVNTTLTLQGLSRTTTEYFSLARNRFDTTGPIISEFAPQYTIRNVTISENFPCDRGLWLVKDSARSNFTLFGRYRTFGHFSPRVGGVYRDSSWMTFGDSLVVTDSLANAKAIYMAWDSAGNRSEHEVLYSPQADVLPPVVSVAQSTAGKYTINASEIRPWDRGLVSISLQAGATNLVFDNAIIYSRRLGSAFLHIVDMSLPAHGCVEAADSLGNIGTYCIDRTIGVKDSLPPQITLPPVLSPINLITAGVTELRPNDIGLANIVVEPALNIGTAAITYVSPFVANVAVSILDSLQPVRAWISASDSLGNAVLDTLRYDPQADVNAPVCAVETLSPTERLFRTTDLAPWDRGIESITIIGTPTNFTIGPVIFVDRAQATQLFTIIDPTKSASVVVQATDSVGHSCLNTITISATIIPLTSFSAGADVDFLTHVAPFDSTADVVVTNPNESPVIVTKITQTGELGAITSDLAIPLVFQGQEQKTIHIRLNTSILGSWNAGFELANDTLPLAHFTATGTTTGLVHLTLDTVRDAHSAIRDTLRLTVDAIPNPINLDSLTFDINYDGDLIEFGTPLIDCAGGDVLCNFDVKVSNPSPGLMQFLLVRTSQPSLSSLSATNSIVELPLITYVSRNNSSPVTITNLYSPLCALSSDQGLVAIGDECGDPSLRAYLTSGIDAVLESIIPNPTSNVAVATIRARVQSNGYEVEVTNMLGTTVRRIPSVLSIGTNTITVPVGDLPSGTYTISLKKNGIGNTTLPLVVVH